MTTLTDLRTRLRETAALCVWCDDDADKVTAAGESVCSDHAPVDGWYLIRMVEECDFGQCGKFAKWKKVDHVACDEHASDDNFVGEQTEREASKPTEDFFCEQCGLPIFEPRFCKPCFTMRSRVKTGICIAPGCDRVQATGVISWCEKHRVIDLGEHCNEPGCDLMSTCADRAGFGWCEAHFP